jgi:choline-sulfatase
MPDRANLLIILAESHSQKLLGCYGDPLVRTPHLDGLAGRGVRFGNAYCTSPICVPSRASLATGLYPHQNGFWDNSIPFDGSVESWMRRAREAGHRVSAIGKLHFRSQEDDNGFTEEIDTMHVADGLGELIGLLRSTGEEPIRDGLWHLYIGRTGVGEETSYQDYDRRITAEAVRWLEQRRGESGPPWVLCVHYVSAHPPFTVPQRLFDLYPPERMPLPVQFLPDERPRHPALEHLRTILGHTEHLDEATMRKITACYYAVITHLDEQVGELLGALDAAGLTDSTRVVYTADHGYNCGNQYVLGLFNLYQRSVSVPMIMAGPDVPAGRSVGQIVSHVDLYPTFLEALGVAPTEREASLPGTSLWPAIDGREAARLGFAEYHALGSKSGAFMMREGDDKLVYHVGMAPQLFDLASDPDETLDVVAAGTEAERAAALEATLRSWLDPEDVDRRAKADQLRKVEEYGGKERVLELRSGFVYSPPPGVDWREA